MLCVQRKFDLKQIELVNSNLQKRLEQIREMQNGVTQKKETVRSAYEAETDLVRRTDETLQNTRQTNEELLKLICDLKAKKQLL